MPVTLTPDREPAEAEAAREVGEGEASLASQGTSQAREPQKPGTACQARPASGASSRVTVPSISPYGRSAA
jgi:hypothetical protein